MMSKSSYEWILAQDAVKKLGRILKNDLDAKNLIADYLRDGHLRAQARMMFLSYDATIHLAWRNQPPYEFDDKYINISSSDWLRSKRWVADQADWRWPTSNLFVTIDKKPVERLMFHAVELSLADLRQLQPAAFNPRAGVGGNPGKMDSRDAFWHAVVTLALDDRLDHTCYRTQEDLLEAINGITVNQVYEKTVMKKLISQVWQKFVMPKTPIT